MRTYYGWGGQRDGPDKMRELILYVVDECEHDKRLGSTKLNKILFYADFLAYVYLGASITGYQYKALPNGPVPTMVLPLRNDMVDRGELIMYEQDAHGKTQHRFAALRKPDLSVFDVAEIDVVNDVIGQLWGKTAKFVSNLSHQFAGWHFADEEAQEEIPYEVALVGRRQLTIGEVKKGLELEDLAAQCLMR